MIQPSQGIKPSTADFKADYDKYVAKATILIHTQETSDAILQTLTGADPVQRVADASVMVMQRLDGAARTAGIEVQDTVKIFGAKAVVDLVIELGQAAGKFKMDESLAELALSVATQDYIKAEIAAGRINAQKLKVAMEADMRKMPPKMRKDIQGSQQRIQATARKYNHGRGGEMQPEPMEQEQEMMPQEPQQEQPSGLIAQAQG